MFRVQDYDLATTLDSGQAFRWKRGEDGLWTGVVGSRWVRLTPTNEGILAETTGGMADWLWLEHYLQIHIHLPGTLGELPENPLLSQAIRKHWGLRLLRQDPWECLASFILSSTKKIIHIRQIVGRLCRAYGDPVETPPGEPAAHAFPTPARIACLEESDLRRLRMGFRAPYLLEAARRVATGRLNLEEQRNMSLPEARATLMDLPGVGRKIADCVLLFALGFDEAFPVDVWVMRALRSAWFPNEAISLPRLVSFSERHFGRHGGYAQQYLFHHVRTEVPLTKALSPQ